MHTLHICSLQAKPIREHIMVIMHAMCVCLCIWGVRYHQMEAYKFYRTFIAPGGLR